MFTKNTEVKIDLHCHSSISDGSLPPNLLAQRLADAGVSYASLTDHNSIDGLALFRQAAEKLGIVCINGLELTSSINNREIHILAYGFDDKNNDLVNLLFEIIQKNSTTGMRFVPDATRVIGTIHKAGGVALLAHPSLTEPDESKLKHLLDILKNTGLDGIETIYGPIPKSEQDRLRKLANSMGLIESAGTDSHFSPGINQLIPGMNVAISDWKQIRNGLINNSRSARNSLGNKDVMPVSLPANPSDSFIRAFLLHVGIPSFIAMLLFTILLLFVFLPEFESALLERKREMIRELTKAATGVLYEALSEFNDGVLSLDAAQGKALNAIAHMRYGKENKDYFWVQDISPRMLMHPYRKDLNGTDLSTFRDARGIHIFSAFADLAKKNKEGYVHYVWQWKDDEHRMEPKESYIKLFEPWGWIIGTGLYRHDIEMETARLEKNVIRASLAIAFAVFLLIVYLVRQNLKLQKKRVSAERQLMEATERYRTLVEAATEGALFVSGEKLRYANPVMLEFIGCNSNELELLDIYDIFEKNDVNRNLFETISVSGRTDYTNHINASMKRFDNTVIECIVKIKSTGNDSNDEFMLLVRPNEEHTPISFPAGSSRSIEKLLGLPFTIAEDIVGEIGKCDTNDETITICKRTPLLARSLLYNGAYAPEIARMLSNIADAASAKFISLAIKELGNPPCQFAFLALGSHGRQEQTLFTDQDNCIIYEDTPHNAEQIANYFSSLSASVCSNLVLAGYRECKGKIMANNPEWCKPLQTWKKYFSEWIKKGDGHELMEFSVFFDFRTVYGDALLASNLREHVFGELSRSVVFYPQVAKNALAFKTPMRLFGTIIGKTGEAVRSGQLDLKTAAMPIVSFARLYSLKSNLSETNTLSRLDTLSRKGIILPSQQQNIATAWESLLRLRLRHQSNSLDRGVSPDNIVDPSWLGHIEEALLNECFKEIDLIQNQIRRDFLGGENI